MKISIIGAGEIGMAISSLFKEKNYQIIFWDKDPSKVGPSQGLLSDCVDGADVIFICIPSNFVRGLLDEIKEYNIKSSVIVGVSKGMEADTNMTNIETFKDVFPTHNRFAIISGPMLAEEISDGKVASAVLASEDDHSLKLLEEVFSSTRLITSSSKNVLQISTLGILKNIYAILCGASDGLENGNNTKAYLITRCLSEMEEVLEILFGNGEDAYGYAGLGDLIATSSGFFSKNYSFGFEISKYGKSEIQSEGRISAPFFYDKLKDSNKNFPLFLTVKDIIDGVSAKEAFLKNGLLK